MKILKYLREVSVVIVGVAVTLFASDYLGRKNEKKDIALSLNAIKMEIEVNRNRIVRAVDYLQPFVDYSHYLIKHKNESLSADSLLYYIGSINNISYSYTVQTSAFESFKSSGLMHRVQDKELLQSIWLTYENLNYLKQEFEKHESMKLEQFWKNDAANLTAAINLTIAMTTIKKPPLYEFHVLYFTGYLSSQCKRCVKSTENLLEKLEASKLLK